MSVFQNLLRDIAGENMPNVSIKTQYIKVLNLRCFWHISFSTFHYSCICVQHALSLSFWFFFSLSLISPSLSKLSGKRIWIGLAYKIVLNHLIICFHVVSSMSRYEQSALGVGSILKQLKMKRLHPFVSTEYCLIYSIRGMFTTFKLSWLDFSGHRYTKQISQYNQRHMRHAVILADVKQIWFGYALPLQSSV